MTIPSNIKRFNTITATTFALLYEAFPVPRPLLFAQVFDISLHQEFIDDRENYPEIQKDIVFLSSAIAWLEEAGYISSSRYDYPYGFTEVVLTAKGLEVMNAIPDSLTAGQTLGSFLKDVVSKGVTESAIKGVQFALAKGLEYVPLVIRAASN